jgi:hypothetical protein
MLDLESHSVGALAVAAVVPTAKPSEAQGVAGVNVRDQAMTLVPLKDLAMSPVSAGFPT